MGCPELREGCGCSGIVRGQQNDARAAGYYDAKTIGQPLWTERETQCIFGMPLGELPSGAKINEHCVINPQQITDGFR